MIICIWSAIDSQYAIDLIDWTNLNTIVMRMKGLPINIKEHDAFIESQE